MIHNPPNDHIINEIWAFCSKDETGEGILGYQAGHVLLPLVTADHEMIDRLRDVAKNIGEMGDKRIVLKHFKLVGTEEIIK